MKELWGETLDWEKKERKMNAFEELQIDGRSTTNMCHKLLYLEGDTEEEIRSPMDVSRVHG